MKSQMSVGTALSAESEGQDVLKKAHQLKIKRARRRNSQLKKIAKESRKTLMMYSKQTNVLEQFAQELKETTREDSDDELVEQYTAFGSS